MKSIPRMDETSHKKRLSCGRQEKSLPYFSDIAAGFASAEATKGLSDRPLETFGPRLIDSLANSATVGFALA